MLYTSLYTGEEIDAAIAEVIDLKDLINILNSNITAINNSINTINSNINNNIPFINTEIDNINSKILLNNEKLATINDSVDNINGKISNLHPSLLLPKNYFPMEYISATAGPRLNTNLIIDFNNDIEIILYFKLSTTGVRQFLFGNYPTTPNLNIELTTGNLFRLYISESATYDTNGKTAMAANTLYCCRLVWDKNTSIFKLYLDNNLEVTSNAVSFFKNYTVPALTLFLDQRDNATSTFTKQISIYRYIVKENNKTIMDLIPCIKDNGQKVFFNSVNNNCLANTGSGSFTGALQI